MCVFDTCIYSYLPSDCRFPSSCLPPTLLPRRLVTTREKPSPWPRSSRGGLNSVTDQQYCFSFIIRVPRVQESMTHVAVTCVSVLSLSPSRLSGYGFINVGLPPASPSESEEEVMAQYTHTHTYTSHERIFPTTYLFTSLPGWESHNFSDCWVLQIQPTVRVGECCMEIHTYRTIQSKRTYKEVKTNSNHCMDDNTYTQSSQ